MTTFQNGGLITDPERATVYFSRSSQSRRELNSTGWTGLHGFKSIEKRVDPNLPLHQNIIIAHNYPGNPVNPV
jgi:hypothetical protein